MLYNGVVAIGITFTLSELWLLHQRVREDPIPVSGGLPCHVRLNDELVAALHACYAYDLREYTLELDYDELLAIDYCIKRDMKEFDGASGEAILLKTFAARAALRDPYPTVQEPESRERRRKKHAS